MFKTKGWQFNSKINKDDEQMVDSKGEIGLAGYNYHGGDDYFRPKAPSQHTGRKWRGALIQSNNKYFIDLYGK